jgi:hypothetical protein
MSTYDICAHRECERICKERAFGKHWCPHHLHILVLNGILDSEPYLKAISGESL